MKRGTWYHSHGSVTFCLMPSIPPHSLYQMRLCLVYYVETRILVCVVQVQSVPISLVILPHRSLQSRKRYFWSLMARKGLVMSHRAVVTWIVSCLPSSFFFLIHRRASVKVLLQRLNLRNQITLCE